MTESFDFPIHARYTAPDGTVLRVVGVTPGHYGLWLETPSGRSLMVEIDHYPMLQMAMEAYVRRLCEDYRRVPDWNPFEIAARNNQALALCNDVIAQYEENLDWTHALEKARDLRALLMEDTNGH